MLDTYKMGDHDMPEEMRFLLETYPRDDWDLDTRYVSANDNLGPNQFRWGTDPLQNVASCRRRGSKKIQCGWPQRMSEIRAATATLRICKPRVGRL
ncbi:hypothetical protein [Aliiroseovarius sp. F20344]|uniref:hypothetical protein n=1 Tax=Aliiroseovarius sp. F20344 TaxID=2926414 RepID=UPI001FF16DCD|nr:hypothetical protein [Aliiroseovarius sp. F20344]MCK0142764.1 hypothetical protein [Aliiroseovarius sp. F20344]